MEAWLLARNHRRILARILTRVLILVLTLVLTWVLTRVLTRVLTVRISQTYFRSIIVHIVYSVNFLNVNSLNLNRFHLYYTFVRLQGLLFLTDELIGGVVVSIFRMIRNFRPFVHRSFWVGNNPYSSTY